MKFKFYWLILLISFHVAEFSFAQHITHEHKNTDSIIPESDNIKMSHSFSRNLPMTRNGSGTGWMPDTSIIYAHGIHARNWMLMFHSNLFLRYNKQDVFNKGNRGDKKIDAPNWLMLMGQKNIGKQGLFHFSIMLSGDPFTIGSEGYPLLFQSGETYQGKRLVDRQHPHDLFSELSMAYTQMISKDIDITGYVGYPGEPALGPVAFMHRNSALNNPDAPLGHHWQDATHISFGVITLGIRYKMFKIEGSSFTGREPDEKRYDFDKPRFDSYSFRLLCNPTKQISLQVSKAFLKMPEIAEPGINVNRTTTSIIYQLPFERENRYVSTTIVCGLNKKEYQENSFLAESTLQLDRVAVYGRYEWIQKSAEELELFQFVNGHTTIFNIQAFTLGINYVLIRKYGNNIAVGIQGTLFIPDDRLISLYSQRPVSGEVYLRFYPHLMHMHEY